MGFRPDTLELGLGLIAIGRVWGVAANPTPTEAEAQDLLDAAITEGIRVFDTAPAYGSSERRLGDFLDGLPPAVRAGLVVMTKVGEHWSDEDGEPYVDHRRDAMLRSLDRSQELLGRIDVLQLHKATEEAIAHPDTEAVVAEAAKRGITTFGASVSSVAAGRLALRTGLFQALQFPLNPTTAQMEPLLPALAAAGGFPVLNRPFAMGGLVAAGGVNAGRDAFRFLRERVPQGVVLTGTSKAAHLLDNVRSFAAA